MTPQERRQHEMAEAVDIVANALDTYSGGQRVNAAFGLVSAFAIAISQSRWTRAQVMRHVERLRPFTEGYVNPIAAEQMEMLLAYAALLPDEDHEAQT